MTQTVKSDISIAQQAKMLHIRDIAAKLGLNYDQLEPYGKHKAKLPLHLAEKDQCKYGKLILISAITPTPAGEGKTTVSIGLNDGLNRIGKKSLVVLREPSLGPVFGIKGGATGGGYSQLLPMEDINLHFTGDFAAIEKANNLLAALIDNNLQSKGRSLNLDGRTVAWKRVMDMNDRSLRRMVCGLGGLAHGVPRETGFDITAASEIMAILCLADDLPDLKRRLGDIFIGFTFGREPIHARGLNAQGAMAALLKDAVKPNLIQSLEGNPAIMHGGPFANIAQGTNTVIATRTGLCLADYVVTEAGFGFDLGGEKFLDIKCQSAGFDPCAVVLVATVRALKYHGGVELPHLTVPNAKALARGLENLSKQVENVRHFQLTPIVAINRFATDTDEEHQVILDHCQFMGVQAAVMEGWEKGGAGAEELAELVAATADRCTAHYKPLYDWKQSVREKIEIIATRIYGAAAVEYAPGALMDLDKIKRLGLEHLPVCIAKTQSSLSDQPSLRGRPRDFVTTIREIEIAAGAGFLVPITGNMMRMPGLPEVPSAEKIDIDERGLISGLF
jgi:formate--tetrahydrofolate ligase